MRSGVKCRGARRAPGLGRFRSAIGRAFAALSVALAAPAGAQLLLGEDPTAAAPRRVAPLDPRIPTGAVRASPARPRTARPPACSTGPRALCVHAEAGVPEVRALAWLAALEAAHEALVGVLRSPAPLPDGPLGGSAATDLYLAPGADPLEVVPDAALLSGAHDAASGWCRAGADGGPLEREAALCLGELAGLALDAAETPSARRALATSLWWALGRPGSLDVAAVDDVQAAPERGLLARERHPGSEGAALLVELLDHSRGRGAPAELALALHALSGWGRSPPGVRFVNEPDAWDVFRATFGPGPTDTARLWGELALRRALLGPRDVERALPALAFAGDAARVRFDWVLPWSSLPRRVVPARPLEPMGVTYLYVPVDVAVRGSLAFRAEWEPPAAFQWVIALLDSGGGLLRRVDVPYQERATSVERTVADPSGAAGILVVGANLGGLGPSYPFDPDFEPFEPRSFSVYLTEL